MGDHKQLFSLTLLLLSLTVLSACSNNTKTPAKAMPPVSGKSVDIYDCWEQATQQFLSCTNVTCSQAAQKQAELCATKAISAPEFCSQVPKDAQLRQQVVIKSCEIYSASYQYCVKALNSVTNKCF